MTIIEIIVAPDGASRLETKGFVGASCRDASRFLEEALGRRLQEQLATEFYSATTPAQQVAEEQAP